MSPGYIPISNLNRDYYKAKEVCTLLGITPRTLRYWESLGLLDGIQRTLGNTRVYHQSDIEVLQKIITAKQQGLSLEEIAGKLEKKSSLAPQGVKLLLDSTFGIDAKKLAEHSFIEIIPMLINFGCYTYADSLDISAKNFAEIKQKKRVLPDSAAPSKEFFMTKFSSLLQAGYSQIISLHADSRIVGSYDNALAAAKALNLKNIAVIDTGLLGLANHFLVDWLLAANKLSVKAIGQKISALQKSVSEIFFIKDPKLLLNKAVAAGVATDLLDFVPVLQHTSTTGLVTIARASNLAEAFEQVLPKMPKQAQLKLAVTNSSLLASLPQQLQPLAKQATFYSSTFSTNLASEAIGLAFLR